MHIAIDFDDTLMDTHNVPSGYRMGPPLPGAVAVLTRLKDAGHTLTIFTSRNVQRPEVRKAVLDWCQYFRVPVHNVTNVKSSAFDVIIDDRALHFVSWTQALADLSNPLPSYTHGATNHTVPSLIADITQSLIDK